MAGFSNQQSFTTTGGAVQRRSELLTIAAAADAQRDRLSACVARLDNLRDRAFGGRPPVEAANQAKLASVRSGALGEIDGTMTAINTLLDGLEALAGELDQLA